jgi:hypothetical protein
MAAKFLYAIATLRFIALSRKIHYYVKLSSTVNTLHGYQIGEMSSAMDGSISRHFLAPTVSLDNITEAYKIFGERRDGVNVAIKPESLEEKF